MQTYALVLVNQLTTAMLQYFKTILRKVSFSRELFEKELRKAIKSLITQELEELKKWCFKEFGSKFQPILIRNFS
ncbi:MAG: hypothetical protein AAF363_00715 [Bacteroidota bacterium]